MVYISANMFELSEFLLVRPLVDGAERRKITTLTDTEGRQTMADINLQDIVSYRRPYSTRPIPSRGE